MQKIITWIQNNKLLALIVATFIFYILLNNQFSLSSSRMASSESFLYSPGAVSDMAAPSSMGRGMDSSYMPDPVTPSTSTNRMVVQNARLSLLVKDVTEVQRQIVQHVTSLGGHMVSREVNRPTEQPYGTISFRVPAEKLESTLDQIKTYGLKVTYETITGFDVTDQYEDLDTRIGYLKRSLDQMLALQDQATRFEDVLRATQEVQNLQRQIDDLIGRQNHLRGTAQMSLVNVDLSTDELALPYAPDTNFRPAVIYKQAVRSLVSTLQNLGELAIWLAVYSVVWLPLLIAYILYRKYHKTSQTTSTRPKL